MKSYGEFDLKDYHFTALGPEGDHDPLQWEIVVTRGGLEVRRDIVPMEYAPRFGVDVGDVFARDAKVEQIIAELKL